MDISGVDFPEREKRFEVVYHLLSVRHSGRIRVKTYAGEADPVPSAVELFSGADWYGGFFLERVNCFSNLFPLTGTNERLGIFTVFSSAAIQTCKFILSVAEDTLVHFFLSYNSRRILTDYG